MRALNNSLHGRPITVISVNPAVTVVHTIPNVDNIDRASLHDDVHLEICNPGDADVDVEIHFNNGALYKKVPAHDGISMDFAIEGDSPACTVANPNVAITLRSLGIDPQTQLPIEYPEGTKVTVAGGYTRRG